MHALTGAPVVESAVSILSCSTFNGRYRGVAMVSAETHSENMRALHPINE